MQRPHGVAVCVREPGIAYNTVLYRVPNQALSNHKPYLGIGLRNQAALCKFVNEVMVLHCTCYAYQYAY